MPILLLVVPQQSLPIMKLGALSLPGREDTVTYSASIPTQKLDTSLPLWMVTSSIEWYNTIGPGCKGQDLKQDVSAVAARTANVKKRPAPDSLNGIQWPNLVCARQGSIGSITCWRLPATWWKSWILEIWGHLKCMVACIKASGPLLSLGDSLKKSLHIGPVYYSPSSRYWRDSCLLSKRERWNLGARIRWSTKTIIWKDPTGPS
jgi:hypothetical protein